MGQVANPVQAPQLAQAVPHAQCCKLLQECVRMAGAATAIAVAPSCDSKQALSMLGCVGLMLTPRLSFVLNGPPGDSVPIPSYLVSSVAVAAAGDVTGPSGLQLFGLLCSSLKAYTTTCAGSKAGCSAPHAGRRQH